MAAMSRVNIPENERKDFYLYVDEFQNFATDSFADILSEARKYRLNLVVAHQYIEQLPETVQAAVFGNVGTLICFRVGAADAEKLVLEFTPFFTEEDLVNLPAFAIYLKLMIDGVSSDPFSSATLPPLFENYRTNNTAKVISVSRERYSHPRSEVEEKINRWSGMEISNKLGELASREEFVMGDIVPSQDNARSSAGSTISLSDLGAGRSNPKPRFDDRPRREPSRFEDRSRREVPPRREPLPRSEFKSNAPSEDRNNEPRSRSSGDNRQNEPRPASFGDNRREPQPARRPLSANGPKSALPKEEKPLFNARCTLCGKDFKLKFKPELGRPAYCEDCFKKVREERRKKSDERDPNVRMLEDLPVKQDVLQAPAVSLASLLPKPTPIRETDDGILEEEYQKTAKSGTHQDAELDEIYQTRQDQ
jgi:CxxC-x17-CxxC domain-containing protein